MLSRIYWQSIYGCLRQMGRRPEEAEELAQKFYTDVILGRRIFERADSAKGKLRTLIRAALKNFLRDEARRERAAKSATSLNSGACRAVAEAPDIDAIIEAGWVSGILNEAISLTAEHYLNSASERYWLAFEAWVLRPAKSHTDRPPRAELARQLGFSNEAHLSIAIHHVRQKMKVNLRLVVSKTAESQEECEDELRWLESMLAPGRKGPSFFD